MQIEDLSRKLWLGRHQVYYATTQESTKEITIKEMKRKLAKISKERSTFKKYKIVDAKLRPDQTVILTVNRTFRNKDENTVTYILEKVNFEWKFKHIARVITGVVKEIFPVNGNTAYIVGDEEHTMFFLDSGSRNIQVTDEITIEGYLETSYHLQGNFFYHGVNVQKLNHSLPIEAQMLN
jgi:hypothetical protein